MLARLFVLIGSLVVLALTAALVGPYFIDWTSYRSDFEREASRIFGRTVKVEGKARARLLPFPSLAFTDVKVAGNRPDEPWLSIDSFSMDAELAPLLRGEILIVDMRIERPHVTLDVREDGRIDWTLNPDLRVNPEQIGMERITIEQGAIRLRHLRGGRVHVIDELDARLAARSLAGPWRMEGALRLDGQPLQVTGSTGSVSADGAMYLRLQAQPDQADALLDLEGNLSFGSGFAYSGTFRLASGSKNASSANTEPFSISIEEPGGRVFPEYRLSGEFELDHRQLEIGAFRFESGSVDDPYAAEGTAFFDFGMEPHFTVEMEGQQMRLGERADRAEAIPFKRRLAELQGALELLPHPAIPGTVRFRLPALVAGNTTIRQLELAAEPVKEGWRLRHFTAQMPGRTTLEASGVLALGDVPAFNGSLLLAIAQPSGFAAWLSDDVDEAIRRLPAAGFSATVTLSSQRQSFRELELALGNARFKGEIDHHAPDDSRPAMLLRLRGGELDVDGLLALAALFVDDRGAARFAAHDLDLELEAGPVHVAGLRAERIDTAMRIKDGQMEIDRLSIADIAGATLSATGRIDGIPDQPAGTLDAAIISSDLAPLARLVAESGLAGRFSTPLRKRLAIEPELLRDGRVNLVASAAANRDGTTGLAISANGLAGGSAFSLSGSATRADDEFAGPVSLSVSLRNDDAARVLAAIGVPVLPLGMSEAAEVVFSLRGDPRENLLLEASLNGDSLRSSFAGKVSGIGERPLLEGQASLSSEDIEPWLASAGMSFSDFGWGTPAKLDAGLSYDGERIRLTELAGEIAEAAVSGALTFGLEGDQPRVEGRLAMDRADLAPLLAILAGPGSLPSSGRDWADQAFTAEPALSLAGEVSLEAGRLLTGIGPVLQDVSLKLMLDSRGLRLHDLSASVAGGLLTGDFDFTNDAGTGLLSMQSRLEGVEVSRKGEKLGFDVSADLSASATASGRSFRGLAAALSGSGSLRSNRIVLHGINTDGFTSILSLADALGPDLGEEAAAELALDLVRDGQFVAGGTQLAFTVAGGVIRTPTVVLRHPHASLETAFDLDLADGSVKGEANLVYEPGVEALVGAEPAVRIIISGNALSPEVEYDTGPLARYLTQRALEIEQYRVEAMQERLLERQRLRREAAYYAESRDRSNPVPSPPPAQDAGSEAKALKIPQIELELEESSEDESGSEAGAFLPESTDIIPVRRDEMAPMRLTPLPAPAVQPKRQVVREPPPAPRAEKRSLIDLLFR